MKANCKTMAPWAAGADLFTRLLAHGIWAGFPADAAAPFARCDVFIDGEPSPARPNPGILSRPLSFIGLPVIAAPSRRPGQLPLGIQIIGAPGVQAMLLAVAGRLARIGMVRFPAAAEAGMGNPGLMPGSVGERIFRGI
jgi:hypothetical protein